MLLETIPFKIYTGGVIVFEAKFGNNPQTLNFILDTGSSGISLDSATCVELNIPLRPTDTTIVGIAGSHKVSYAFNQKFTTGKLVTEKINFYVNDYSILTSVYGEKIDGIVGYSFLSKYIFDINFDSSHIKIYKPGKFEYPNGGTFIHPVFNKLLVQQVILKDKEKVAANVYLDSGAGLSLLLTDEYIKDNNIIFPRRKPVITQVQGLGGKKKMRLTVIKRLKLGPFTFRNVPTNLYNDEENVTSYPYTAGLLGNDILRRFNITYNYPAREIYLKPNNSFDEGFDYSYTGLSLYNYNNKVIADDIIANSPAEKAGIKNGDIIIGVSNNFSGDVQAYEKLLQKAKENIKIVINRNEKILLISLWPISIK
ncbi:MAG: signal protein PDZ [Ferruginibacter sp.]|nr:signal protein PDZ [Ferruginibacter sp.]